MSQGLAGRTSTCFRDSGLGAQRSASVCEKRQEALGVDVFKPSRSERVKYIDNPFIGWWPTRSLFLPLRLIAPPMCRLADSRATGRRCFSFSVVKDNNQIKDGTSPHKRQLYEIASRTACPLCFAGGGQLRAPAPLRQQGQPVRSGERAHQVGP